MTTDSQGFNDRVEPSAAQRSAAETAASTCARGGCRTWSCPPCLLVWGVALVVLLVNLVMEVWR